MVRVHRAEEQPRNALDAPRNTDEAAATEDALVHYAMAWSMGGRADVATDVAVPPAFPAVDEGGRARGSGSAATGEGVAANPLAAVTTAGQESRHPHLHDGAAAAAAPGTTEGWDEDEDVEIQRVLLMSAMAEEGEAELRLAIEASLEGE